MIMPRRFTGHRPKPARFTQGASKADAVPREPARPAMDAALPRAAKPSPAAQAKATKPGATKPRAAKAEATKPVEIGGPDGPEPTRYGDWERKGICVDF